MTRFAAHDKIKTMTIKHIKRIGSIASITIGAMMAIVYIFSVIGLNSLAAYHRDALIAGGEWFASLSREDKIRIVDINRIISFVLMGFALALKVTAFILLRRKAGEKNIAITLIALKAAGIVLKTASIIIAVPALAYLTEGDVSIQVKFAANILFIAAQSAVIVMGVLYLIKLSKEKKKGLQIKESEALVRAEKK